MTDDGGLPPESVHIPTEVSGDENRPGTHPSQVVLSATGFAYMYGLPAGHPSSCILCSFAR